MMKKSCEEVLMLQGLAIWHYPHRTIAENVRYFAAVGLDSVSVHGSQFARAISDPAIAEEIATAVADTGVVFTVHGCLPRSHTPEAVAVFEAELELLSRWQRAHRLISVLSFDVPQPIRKGTGIGGYVERVLNTVPDCKVAVEDFGLTPDEVEQIRFLKGNDRFGYLVDLGHLFLRLCGRNASGKTLFTNSPYEHPSVAAPDATHFYNALAAKEFPIWEMHLHNNDGESDLHWFLEEGCLDVAGVAQALRALDFQGVLTVESAPGFRFECRGADADEGIRKTLAYWEKCLEEA
jgi:sugar phosphate isomerase/epimerase